MPALPDRCASRGRRSRRGWRRGHGGSGDRVDIGADTYTNAAALHCAASRDLESSANRRRCAGAISLDARRDFGRFALADPNTRQGKRTPVTLKIKFKSETLEQFIERYAVDVSQGGIFIRTKEPLAVGTQMRFEFQLRDASPLIAGEGTVVWTRENDPSRPAIAPGMGVRFDRLAEGSQSVLERILAEKAKQAPQRAGERAPTKPPLFTDTPTRVAPLPGAGSAARRRSRAAREDSSTSSTRRCPSRCRSTRTRTSSPRRGVRGGDEGPRARRADRADRRSDRGGRRRWTALPVRRARGAPRRAAPTARSPIRPRPAAAGARPPFDDLESAPGLPSPPEPGLSPPSPAAPARHVAVAAHRGAAADPPADGPRRQDQARPRARGAADATPSAVGVPNPERDARPAPARVRQIGGPGPGPSIGGPMSMPPGGGGSIGSVDPPVGGPRGRGRADARRCG